MQYRDENRTMIVIVFVSVSVCIYWIYRILCMLVACVSFGDTFFVKTMLSACDISSGATGDSRGTERDLTRNDKPLFIRRLSIVDLFNGLQLCMP